MHWYVQEEDTHVAQPAAGGTTSESEFLYRICNKGLKRGRTVGAVLWRCVSTFRKQREPRSRQDRSVFGPTCSNQARMELQTHARL